MSNRVEELESKVAELQAAVNGLTEELVETKERVRLLEDQVEVDLSSGSRPVGHGDRQTAPSEPTADGGSDAEAEPASEPQQRPGHPDEDPAQTESRSETSDNPADDADFIDADGTNVAPETDGQDDEDKSTEAEEEDETESEDSDIIVA
jgi:hypothetical protein